MDPLGPEYATSANRKPRRCAVRNQSHRLGGCEPQDVIELHQGHDVDWLPFQAATRPQTCLRSTRRHRIRSNQGKSILVAAETMVRQVGQRRWCNMTSTAYFFVLMR